MDNGGSLRRLVLGAWGAEPPAFVGLGDGFDPVAV